MRVVATVAVSESLRRGAPLPKHAELFPLMPLAALLLYKLNALSAKREIAELIAFVLRQTAGRPDPATLLYDADKGAY